MTERPSVIDLVPGIDGFRVGLRDDTNEFTPLHEGCFGTSTAASRHILRIIEAVRFQSAAPKPLTGEAK